MEAAMRHSESLTKIAEAISYVQREVDSVVKNAKNPHFGHTYADLNSFLRAVRDPLREHGITMIQSPGMAGEMVTVETLLVHESGEWISGHAASPMANSDPQGVGSAITYLRRYSLASLLALPQEDDDGNAASTNRSVSSEDAEYHCPECGGAMWDNRAAKAAGKRPKNFPDFKCRDCDHPIWGTHPDDEDSPVEADLPERIRSVMETADQLGILPLKVAERAEEAIQSGDHERMKNAWQYIALEIEKKKADASYDPLAEQEPAEAGAA